jgi:hypothetical protein
VPNRPEQQQPERSSRRVRLLTPGFSLRRHLGVFATAALAATGTATWLLGRVRARDLWIVPAYLLVANVVEYGVHRLLMHRPLPLRALYRGHTLGHHRAFHHDSMEIASVRELELVVMPWYTVAFYFTAIGPVVALVVRAFGRGAGGLFLLTGVSTFVLYEGMHALYHLPAATLERLRLDRSRLFGVLYRHHRHHHRLARMRWVNFNISCPLADRLFGTLEDEQTWQWERQRRGAGLRATGAPPGHPQGEADHQHAGQDHQLGGLRGAQHEQHGGGGERRPDGLTPAEAVGTPPGQAGERESAGGVLDQDRQPGQNKQAG